MAALDLWAHFLAAEGLHPNRVDDPFCLLDLAERLSVSGPPRIRPHSKRVECRELVASVAIDLGIDLAGIRFRGKLAMKRSLLDSWNKVYAKRFGSTFGTAGWKEDRRRIVKTTVTEKVR